jgi:TolB protein
MKMRLMKSPCVSLWPLLAASLAVQGARLSGAESQGEIIFSSNRSGRWRLWIVHADGSGLRQLKKGSARSPGDHDGADHDDVDPEFSPDGKRILFTSTRGGETAVWRVGRDGLGPEKICAGDQAEWSPGGKRIALRRRGKILTRALATGVEKTITPPGWTRCSGPAWSPDGKTIAFACRQEAGNAIFVTGAPGGSPARVYDEKGACEPHWSPDGKLLAYETETHICTIRPDGKQNRLVTYFGGIQRYARWSPDGKRLVFCQAPSENGPWEVYTIPARGGAPAKLTDGGSDMYPDWK